MRLINKISKSIAFRSILIVVTLLIVYSAVSGILGYRVTSQSLYDQYTEDAFQVANAAAFFIDGDSLDEMLEAGEDSELYRETWLRLDQLCNAFDATFVYVIRPELPDYDKITFLFSTVRWDSEYTPYELGYVRTTTNDEYKLKYRNLYEGSSSQELLLLNGANYKRSSHHITAMVPVKDTDQRTKAIICVQRPMDEIRHIQMSYVSHILRRLLMLAALEIIGIELYLSEQLIKPVTKITEEASRFARENETAEKKLTDSIRGQDEIGVLAQSIDRMEEQITDYVRHLTAVTAEKERISTELNVARRIQADMLPSVFPAFPDHDDFDIFASMTPAKEVGGDFYDFFLVDDDHLAMVMADVSGKGVPAALFMVITKTLIKNRAQMGDSPANAGHEHPVLCRKGGRYELVVYRHSMAVAAMEDIPFKEHGFELHPGDRLFVYTDGVPEATNINNELFGTERMLEVLNRDPDAAPEELLKAVRESVDEFVGEAPQFDDMTMLGFCYNGASGQKKTVAPEL